MDQVTNVYCKCGQLQSPATCINCNDNIDDCKATRQYIADTNHMFTLVGQIKDREIWKCKCGHPIKFKIYCPSMLRDMLHESARRKHLESLTCKFAINRGDSVDRSPFALMSRGDSLTLERRKSSILERRKSSMKKEEEQQLLVQSTLTSTSTSIERKRSLLRRDSVVKKPSSDDLKSSNDELKDRLVVRKSSLLRKNI
jgi:hypothetical protein